MSEQDNQDIKLIARQMAEGQSKLDGTLKKFYRVFSVGAIIKTTLLLIALVTVVFTSVGDFLKPELPERHIAVIRIQGPIQEGSPTGSGIVLSQALYKAANNTDVKAILILADSPGGSPVQSESFYETLMDYRRSAPLSPEDQAWLNQKIGKSLFKKVTDLESQESKCETDCEQYRKPVIVSIADTCASACVYMASAADKIIAHGTSIVGSIGVRMDTWGFDKLLDMAHVERRTLSAGKFKTLIDPYQPMNPAAKQFVEDKMIVPLYRQFVNAVKNARGDKLADDPSIYEGLVWTGPEAMEKGLVDEIATTFQVYDALRHNYHLDSFREYNRQKFSWSSMFEASFTHAIEAVMKNVIAQQSTGQLPKY
ncbi:S49 family peptidase [Motilimonas cestriensis]|uniref:S49 family peptidase n=1 Tax=Motilimonas cestriensis TaxID=2742685 RepID=A0ABS8WI19_9GAMM|nr:S49 family peptidase [Motilimonas cestriensis]MCE2597296.1 S49 family peptidase [Motilimonas cestriensis]